MKGWLIKSRKEWNPVMYLPMNMSNSVLLKLYINLLGNEAIKLEDIIHMPFYKISHIIYIKNIYKYEMNS